jgi:hypothetical protein
MNVSMAPRAMPSEFAATEEKSVTKTPSKTATPLVPVLNRPPITRGTDSSNPSPSSGESATNRPGGERHQVRIRVDAAGVNFADKGTKRSTPASAAEYTGPPPGGSPLAGYRGGVISTHRPMGTPRARWCAPARSPPWFYGRACKTMLKGVSVARLTLWKPPAPITSRTRASPACAGRRTDLLGQRGRHADHHRTRVIKVGRPGSNCLRGGRLPSARRPSTRRPALAIVTCAAAPAGSPMSPLS